MKFSDGDNKYGKKKLVSNCRDNSDGEVDPSLLIDTVVVCDDNDDTKLFQDSPQISRKMDRDSSGAITLPANKDEIEKGLIEGSAVQWKVDTGSKNTFITKECYYNILPECRPMLSRVETQYEVADGKILDILGTATMTICFDEFCCEFPVIVGNVKANLLGEDFISKFQCNWNYATRSLEINGNMIPFSQDNLNVRSSRVISEETITVPPRSEINVRAKLTRKVCDDKKENIFGILCPDSNFMKQCGMALGRVLVDVSNCHFYARILNPGDSDAVLYKGTHIGLFVPVLQIQDSLETNDGDEINALCFV